MSQEDGVKSYFKSKIKKLENENTQLKNELLCLTEDKNKNMVEYYLRLRSDLINEIESLKQSLEYAQMNFDSEKETLKKVADYAEAEKKLVVKRRCIVTFVGTLMFALSIMIGCIVFPKLPEDNFLRSDILGLGIGVIGVVGLWGIVIHGNRKNSMKDK